MCWVRVDVTLVSLIHPTPFTLSFVRTSPLPRIPNTSAPNTLSLTPDPHTQGAPRCAPGPAASDSQPGAEGSSGATEVPCCVCQGGHAAAGSPTGGLPGLLLKGSAKFPTQDASTHKSTLPEPSAHVALLNTSPPVSLLCLRLQCVAAASFAAAAFRSSC